jgi:hypothetical protein
MIWLKGSPGKKMFSLIYEFKYKGNKITIYLDMLGPEYETAVFLNEKVVSQHKVPVGSHSFKVKERHRLSSIEVDYRVTIGGAARLPRVEVYRENELIAQTYL